MEEVTRHGVGIERDVVLDAEFLDEFDDGVVVRATIDRDAEDAQATVVIAFMDGLKVGRFRAAGVAPSGPEIDQECVAAVVGEGDGGAVVEGGGGEIGGGVIGRATVLIEIKGLARSGGGTVLLSMH